MTLAWKFLTVLVTGVAVASVLHSRSPASAPVSTATKSAPAAAIAGCTPPRVLDIGMKTCRPCKMMLQVLDELKQEYPGRLQSDFIDISDDPDEKDKYGVRVIPTQIFYDRAGIEFSRHEGYIPKADLLAIFQGRGIDLSPNCRDGK